MSASAAQQEEGAKLGDLITAAGFFIGLVAAWLYLAGWTYAYTYFDRFRLPLLMLDLPHEHLLVYGFLVLRRCLWWVVGLASVVLVGCAFWPALARRLPRRGQIALALVVTVALFWAGFAAGSGAAMADFLEQRGGDYRAYPRIRLQLGNDEKPTDAAAALPDRQALAEGCYRLLLQNNDRVFLIRPFKNAPAAELPLAVLPTEAIAAMRLLPDYTSCP